MARQGRRTLDAIIARAVPPPERADARRFEPVPTDAAVLARRRAALDNLFGPQQAAAHAAALGLAPDAWFDRFRDVRLAGPDPGWARAFRAVFERLADGELPFAEARRWARAEVEAAWPADLPRRPDALEGPLDYLADRLGGALQPTLRVERGLGARSTWAERFRRSPALAYVVGQVTADWIADCARLARRAAADRPLLARAFFAGEDPGALVRIEAGLGDPHAGGQSVAILRFERGGVVYKPKDLRIAAVVGAVTRRLDGSGLAATNLLTRDGYAWEQAYETQPIADPQGGDAFFGALGGWLALLQALGGADFWFDNLLACGATPRFIDFETAVQPPPEWGRAVRPLTGAAAALVRTSPLAAGILPMPMPLREGEDPTDVGCLARPGVHRSPLPDVEGGGLSSWREDRFAPCDAAGRPLDAADHFDAFEAGYLRVARALTAPALQTRVVAALRQAPDAPVRIIRIDTWTCYRAIRQSCLPRCLSDGVWREIALHAVLPHGRDMVGAIREAAVRDMRRLDVPLFRTRLDSRDLLGVEGERLPDFFGQDAISGVENALRTLAGLPEDERIAWLRSGFGLRAANPPRRRPARGRLPPAGAADLLAWAGEIASSIARYAATDEQGSPTWLGVHCDVFTGVRVVGPLGFDVLSGRAGLAQALTELAEALDRHELAELARETLAGAARDYVEHAEASLRAGAGHVVGGGGLVATLARDPALRPLAVELFRFAASRDVCMRSGADFVSGLAGWRAAAAALGEPAPARHGPERRYAPAVRPRLARWLEPERAAPLCSDRRAAAQRRLEYDRHGSWFAAEWIDDRHNLSGIDGLPALAVRFVRLAGGRSQSARAASP